MHKPNMIIPLWSISSWYYFVIIVLFFFSEDEEGVMVGQSQAVSTEALMNVFHPHDAENLDPKMVVNLTVILV